MMKRKMSLPVSRLFVCSVMAAVLSACGGDGESDAVVPPAEPLAAYRAQTLSWGECGAEHQAMAAGNGVDAARLSCASMRVPMDYADPAKGDLAIEVLRVQALAPDAMTLFVNPGGPGESGLSLSIYLAGIWSDATDANAVGRSMQALAQMYDIVGFAPRGVAGSTALTCPLTEAWQELPEAPAAYDEAVFLAQVDVGRKQAQACLTQPFAPYINTAMTVEDMELLRHLLDAPQFHYLGYSYGTWLGLWYASAYPERVGRMVIDSSMDYQSTMYEEFATVGPALLTVYNEVLFPLAASRPGEFGLGTDTTAMAGIFAALSPPVQEAYLEIRNDAHGTAQKMVDTLYVLAAARELDILLDGAELEDVAAMLDTHVFPAMDSAENMQRMRRAAQLLVARMGNDEEDDDDDDDEADAQAGDADDEVLDASGSLPTNLAVRCADTPWPSEDPRYFQQRTWDSMARNEPVSTEQTYICLNWPHLTAADKPALTQAQAVPVLFVQAQYDLQTPAPGALHSFEALPQAALVYVPREIQHALYPYRDDCVDAHVSTYLETGRVQARSQSCASQVEALLTPTTAWLRRSLAPAETQTAWMAQTFHHPARTNALIEAMPRGGR